MTLRNAASPLIPVSISSRAFESGEPEDLTALHFEAEVIDRG